MKIILTCLKNNTVVGHGFFEWVGVSFEVLDRGSFFPRHRGIAY